MMVFQLESFIDANYYQGNSKTTHQNFNKDMHTDFDVMTDPIPIISFYRDPPKYNKRQKYKQDANEKFI